MKWITVFKFFNTTTKKNTTKNKTKQTGRQRYFSLMYLNIKQYKNISSLYTHAHRL